jgi:hypothetical protein
MWFMTGSTIGFAERVVDVFVGHDVGHTRVAQHTRGHILVGFTHETGEV